MIFTSETIYSVKNHFRKEWGTAKYRISRNMYRKLKALLHTTQNEWCWESSCCYGVCHLPHNNESKWHNAGSQKSTKLKRIIWNY